MPSPILPSQFGDAVPSANADFCDRFTKWLAVPGLLRDLFNWLMNPDGTLSAAFSAEVATYAAPTGTVIYALTQNVGNGWLHCLSRDTKVLLSDGNYRTIKEIVDNRMPVDVASWDEVSGRMVSARVVGWNKAKSSRKEWYRLRFVGSSGAKNLGAEKWHVDATGEHRFWTARGWIKAIDLVASDRIYRRQDTLTSLGREAIVGMYLGDGSINKTGKFTTSHTSPQAAYSEFIAERLGVNVNRGTYNYEDQFCKSVNERLTVCTSLTTLCPGLIPKLKRTPAEIRSCLDELGPVGLAFWIMDDGSLGKDNRQANPYYRLRIHTEGYSSECREVMQEWFKKRFNVTATAYAHTACKPKPDGAGKTLHFSPADSKIIFAAIAPYLLPSMRYKVPEQYWTEFTLIAAPWITTDLVEYRFERRHAPTFKDRDMRVRYKYDITVEGTHCFFANDILVHNCDGREVLRSAYPALFQAIGTRFGDGDTTTTFNLPDGRGRSLIGAGAGASNTEFGTPALTNRDINTAYVGEENHELTEEENGEHSHPNGLLHNLNLTPNNTSAIRRDQDDKSLSLYGSTAPAVGTGSVISGDGSYTNRVEINVGPSGHGVGHNSVHPCLIGFMYVKT